MTVESEFLRRSPTYSVRTSRPGPGNGNVVECEVHGGRQPCLRRISQDVLYCHTVQPQSVNEVTQLPTALSGMSINTCSPDHDLIFDLKHSINLLQTTISRLQTISSLSVLVAGRTVRGNVPGNSSCYCTSYTDYNCTVPS